MRMVDYSITSLHKYPFGDVILAARSESTEKRSSDLSNMGLAQDYLSKGKITCIVPATYIYTCVYGCIYTACHHDHLHVG